MNTAFLFSVIPVKTGIQNLLTLGLPLPRE
jgi:hypothetical protein